MRSRTSPNPCEPTVPPRARPHQSPTCEPAVVVVGRATPRCCRPESSLSDSTPSSIVERDTWRPEKSGDAFAPFIRWKCATILHTSNRKPASEHRTPKNEELMSVHVRAGRNIVIQTLRSRPQVSGVVGEVLNFLTVILPIDQPFIVADTTDETHRLCCRETISAVMLSLSHDWDNPNPIRT